MWDLATLDRRNDEAVKQEKDKERRMLIKKERGNSKLRISQWSGGDLMFPGYKNGHSLQSG